MLNATIAINCNNIEEFLDHLDDIKQHYQNVDYVGGQMNFVVDSNKSKEEYCVAKVQCDPEEVVEQDEGEYAATRL